MNIVISFLIFAPMIIAFLFLSPIFTNNEVVIRRFTKGFCVFHLLYTIALLLFFDALNPYISEINFFGLNWVQSLGIKFIFKIDTISMILCLLTSFIFLMSSIASKFNIRKNHKFYYSMLLLLQSAILGMFTAGDMFVFFLFWELELIPAYFLIANWGEDNISSLNCTDTNVTAKTSAIKFVLFTFFGSMIMLLGILLLHYYNFTLNGILSSTFTDINSSSIPLNIQILITICLLIGFGVKLPIVPLHTWLPDAHTNAPTPVSMILAGILLKTGAYGIFRFIYETLPDAFEYIAPILAIFALVNIIYTAFIAYAQTDIKRIVAYSSISNMGLILLGLCAFNHIGICASVFHMVAHGLVTAGLFMIAGIVYLRFKTRDINTLSGIANSMPRLFAFSLLIVMASIGIPLFAPFISEILTIFASLTSELSIILKFVALFSLPLLILSSCYMLKFLHKSFYGKCNHTCENVKDASIHELIVLTSILTGLIIFGIYPNTILGMFP